MHAELSDLCSCLTQCHGYLWLELQLRAMSWSVTLWQPGSVLMSDASVPIEGCADTEIEGHVGDIQTKLLLSPGSWSYCSRVCAEIRVLYFHKRSHRSPGLKPQPEVLVQSRGNVCTRTTPT